MREKSGTPKTAGGKPDRMTARASARTDTLPDTGGRQSRGSNFPIVVVGASAGGLEAVEQLFTGLPAKPGMAFLLVQHLDPSHKSLMEELLANYTSMKISQAAEGMPIAPDEVYICPPGHFLSVRHGALHVSLPRTEQHVRLPIDLLVRSLAEDMPSRTICVILSGTGTDGSDALAALKQGGGRIIAQEPGEAEYDGMPQSAIDTGLVDAVVPLARMPAELASMARKIGAVAAALPAGDEALDKAGIPAIISALLSLSGHDFRSYKPGTLERRINRRMGLAGFAEGAFDDYLQALAKDPEEREQLAQDLLINVTSFFRDPKVFDRLERKVIPELVRDLAPGQALRIWVAGCSTGEEAYSLAMICRDAIVAARRDTKLQIFASDVDAQAIAVAREGLFPLSITDEVPADRLARYFIKEDHGYRVAPGLRGSVVFAVQDVLHDPPFSRIDLVSCRNLLIYLNPEAQAKAISLFHFALRKRGILLLGSAETPGGAGDRFEVLYKAEHIYRHLAQSQPGDPGFPISFKETVPRLTAREASQQLSRQALMAELCRDLVLQNYAPASVLINRAHQCLYSLGPIGRYLKVVPGHPTLDLLAMAAPDLRATLRYAIRKSNSRQPHFRTGVCETFCDGKPLSFSIDVRSVTHEEEELQLVSFVEMPAPRSKSGKALDEAGKVRIVDLERELEETRAELQKEIQSRDALVLEQKAINDEALSVNEEFQSTNEELLTSKEELQSLNEELIALNGQLQETLERQRTTSDDLQNVLNSTNVATLFLDPDLRIRFYTPATRSIFNVIPGDIGRPLADLNSLATDEKLLGDARDVLRGKQSVEREIRVPQGRWYLRRILPYRTHDESVEGVVITFDDVTDRRKVAETRELAKREAVRLNIGKSRFLAIASHDLRQPLQSMNLIRELLARSVKGEKSEELVARLGQSLTTMAGMLNALLDMSQIEAGLFETNAATFPANTILERMKLEFAPMAKAQGLQLRCVPSSAMLHSDPRVLEEMLRNLLSNALKYTTQGKILLGCRRAGSAIRIEVWDTGIGIEPDELTRIFEEFHQVDNPDRDRSRGFGLGLSIVRYLGDLLGHSVTVKSRPGKGSVFAITVAAGPGDGSGEEEIKALPSQEGKPVTGSCGILVVEDDPDVRELLDQLLTSDGHRVTTAADGAEALKLVAEGAFRPDLILTDYNLPNGLNGSQVLAGIRSRLQQDIPGIVLTGDASVDKLAAIALEDCVLLSKPVAPPDLNAAIDALISQRLQDRGEPAPAPEMREPGTICVVDDDSGIRDTIRMVLEDARRTVNAYPSAEEFLSSHVPGHDHCLVVDVGLPGMDGIELIEHLRQQGDMLPAVVITGRGEIAMAVRAMRAGANDFIEKPVGRDELMDSIDRATAQSTPGALFDGEAIAETRKRLASLTARQRSVLELVLAGHPSKNIAADLAISQRTVETHRAKIMHRLGAKSIPDLVRIALSAAI